MLTKHAIEEFREIYLKTYGKELSFAEAEKAALQFLRLYKFVLGRQPNPQPEEEVSQQTGQ